jgi:hypothetical protein
VGAGGGGDRAVNGRAISAAATSSRPRLRAVALDPGSGRPVPAAGDGGLAQPRHAFAEKGHEVLVRIATGIPVKAVSLRLGRGFSAVTLIGPPAGDLGPRGS